jgi:hypothetical protein
VLSYRAEYTRRHLPDPTQNPISNAIAKELIARLERHVKAIHEGGEGVEREFGDRPGELVRETLELETLFVGKHKSPSFPESAHKAIGNFFVSSGKSYSETRDILKEIEQFFTYLGAPSKRPEALRFLDAKVANRWSYRTLAGKMCDCGASKHTEYCSERIRKRIKELKSFLTKYGIGVPGEK